VWSPDAKRIAFTRIEESGYTSVVVMNADGTGKRRLGSGDVPAWSPDGSKIAFETYGEMGQPTGIYVVNANGTGLTRVAKKHDSGFAWSPDGKKIAYSGGEKRARIHIADVASGVSTTLGEPSSGSVWLIAWSPDGAEIAFDADDGLELIDVATGQVTTLTDESSFTPVWSPDSSRIAFLRNSGLFTIGRDGRDERRLTSVGDWSSLESVGSWTADGSVFVYEKERVTGGDVADIWRVRTNGTGATPITQAFPTGATYESPDWAATTIPSRRTERTSMLSLRPVRILRTPTLALDMSADNGRAAVATSGETGCGPVAIWGARKSATRIPESAECGDADWIEEFAFAGRRAAWTYEEDTSSLSFTGLVTGALGSRARELATADNDGHKHLGNLAGDGPLLVYSTWRGKCCSYYPLRLRKGPVKEPKLWRIVGEGAPSSQLVLAGPDAVDVVAVDASRISVLRPDGVLAIVNETGKRLSAFRLGRRGIEAVSLTGPQFVVYRGKTVEVRDATTGKVKHRWPVTSSDGAEISFEDAQGNFAVYTEGIAIHLLRLSDGRDRVLAIAKQAGPAHAELEPEGLYYSYNETGSAHPGRVAFVPYKELTARFR
jgi:TolB protein